MGEKKSVKCIEIKRKKVIPTEIWCYPEDEKEGKHAFKPQIVYILVDEKGNESVAAICPKHNQPMPIELRRRSNQFG